jgi:hypothetical protein
MRSHLLIAAAAIAASLGSAALAAPAAAPPPLTTTPQQALQGPTVDTSPVVTSADMDALNAHTQSDDATMQGLLTPELRKSDAWLSRILPALPFHGPTYIPPSVFFGITGPDLFHIQPPYHHGATARDNRL